ncbi:MAG: hypothetical protein CMD90_00985 [Gammaproteobacteria bacterium]|nr:hypothetical protein [Gammaproteobacteria bacterium]
MEIEKPSRVKINLYIEKLDFSSFISLILFNFKKIYSIKKVFLIESNYLSNLIKASGFMSFSYLELNYFKSYEKSGIRSGLKVLFSDMAQVIEEDIFRKELNNFENLITQNPELKSFFIKSFSSSPSVFERYENKTTFQIMYLMRVIHNLEEGKKTFLIIKDNRWKKLFINYGRKLNIELHFSKILFNWKAFRFFIGKAKDLFLGYQRVSPLIKERVDKKILIHTNLKKFEVNSCWKDSGLPLTDTTFLNETHLEVFSNKTMEEIKENNSDFFSLSKGYNNQRIKYLPKIFNHVHLNVPFGPQKFFLEQFNNFKNLDKYWSLLFKKENASIYFTQNMYDCSDIAASSAIRRNQGISCICQNSFMEFPCPEHIVSADLLFSHSSLVKRFMNFEAADINFSVITGFVNDYQFSHFKEQSKMIRDEVESKGPKFIVCYFEEYFSKDPRWFLGPEEYKSDHLFLLNLIKNNDDLALILKPKKESLLKEVLGDQYNIYDELINSERCYIFEDGLSNTPGAAAFASDVVINSSIYGASAGVESILCETPTVFIDRDNLDKSIFHKSKSSEFIYNSIEDAWGSIEESMINSETRNFGSWNDIIDLLDPFRDGRAMERVCNYLSRINQELKSGLSREKALSLIAEEYKDKWGQDKIINT